MLSLTLLQAYPRGDARRDVLLAAALRTWPGPGYPAAALAAEREALFAQTLEPGRAWLLEALLDHPDRWLRGQAAAARHLPVDLRARVSHDAGLLAAALVQASDDPDLVLDLVESADPGLLESPGSAADAAAAALLSAFSLTCAAESDLPTRRWERLLRAVNTSLTYGGSWNRRLPHVQRSRGDAQAALLRVAQPWHPLLLASVVPAALECPALADPLAEHLADEATAPCDAAAWAALTLPAGALSDHASQRLVRRVRDDYPEDSACRVFTRRLHGTAAVAAEADPRVLAGVTSLPRLPSPYEAAIVANPAVRPVDLLLRSGHWDPSVLEAARLRAARDPATFARLLVRAPGLVAEDPRLPAGVAHELTRMALHGSAMPDPVAAALRAAHDDAGLCDVGDYPWECAMFAARTSATFGALLAQYLPDALTPEWLQATQAAAGDTTVTVAEAVAAASAACR